MAVVKKENTIQFGTPRYFLECGAAGILSCGITHTGITPVDLVKCRMQADKTLYKGTLDGVSKVFAAGGITGLTTGWAPTAIGYSLQGMFKFGLYEYFKYKYTNIVGHDNAYNWRTSLYLAASASAEMVADIALCPMEAVKVRMQTRTETYGSKMLPVLARIAKEEGLAGFYKGLVPLWCRQIPYTMMKFASFERTVEFIYKQLPKPKEEYGKSTQLGVTFLGGYIAGVLCALVSHPADTIVSKMNKDTTGKSAITWLKELGPLGVWTGLGPRIFMIGTLTGAQWFIYDAYKTYRHMPTSGSKKH